MRARERTTPRGFTLLELLVVLVILAITAAAAVPAFLSESLATPEQKTATALAGALSQARDAARESGAPATLVISPSDGRYWLTTRDSTATGVLPLPGTVRLIGPNADRVECRFEPTGPASPVTITVRGARDVMVRVNGWSGEIGIGNGGRRAS
jgi:type II secretion system protein H